MESDFTNKKLLVLGANPETANIVKVAQKLGVYTVVTDYNPDAPAKKIADKSYNIDALDVDALYKMAVEEKVDGVLVGVADPLIAPYQKLCERLGLPCYATKESVYAFTNKRHFKETCAKYGIKSVPEYSIEQLDDVKFPVIVKPADSNSGKGITLCRTREGLEDAIERAKGESKTSTVLLERYMETSDVSIYYTIVDGKPYLSSLSDRYTLRNDTKSTPICLGDIFPSKYYEEFINNEHPKYCKMIQGLGVKNGVLYVSAFYENGNFYVYDPGFRLQGGGFHLVLKAVNGFDQREMLVKFALSGSMRAEDFKNANDPLMRGDAAAVIWFLLKEGKIKKIEGLGYIKNHSDVSYVIERFSEGDEISSDMIGTERQVFLRVFMRSPNRKVLRGVIQDFSSRLKVTGANDENLLMSPLNPDFIEDGEGLNLSLRGKVVVISGGTKGVGRQAALKAAMLGADVVISGRDSGSAESIEDEAKNYPGSVTFRKTDLHSIKEIESLFDFVGEKFGRLDGFVNYAGVTPAAALVECSEALFDEVFSIDIKAAFFCCQNAIKLMRKSGGGAIVLVGSTHHRRGNKDRAAYACAKGALFTLSNHIARHYAADKIRCNYLVMGWTPTDGELALRKSQGMTEAELREEAAKSIPLGRMTEANDIVPGIIYLLSDYSYMLTGAEFTLNGGELI